MAGQAWASKGTACAGGWWHSEPLYVGVDEEPRQEPLWTAAVAAEMSGELAEAEELYLQLAEQPPPVHGCWAERCLAAVARLAAARGDGCEVVEEIRTAAATRKMARLGLVGGLHSAAPVWRLTVWVDGEPAGTFPADSTAVVLGYPPVDPAGRGGGAGLHSGSNGSSRRLSGRPPMARLDEWQAEKEEEWRVQDESPEEPQPLWVTERWEEAAALHAYGHSEAAEKLFQQLAEEASTDPWAAELCLYNIGVMAEQAADFAAADAVYADVEQRCIARLAKLTVAAAQQLEPAEGDTANAAAALAAEQLLLRVRTGVANLLDQRGESGAAEALCEQVATAQAGLLGEDHPDTLRSLMNLAGFMSARDGGLEEAGALAAMVVGAFGDTTKEMINPV